MVVYLDLVILSTVLVNTLMIMGIECILNGKLSIIRVILSNVVLVLSLGLYLINIKELIFIAIDFIFFVLLFLLILYYVPHSTYSRYNLCVKCYIYLCS